MTSQERIRALRDASNTALEAHDVNEFMRFVHDDYVGTAGNGGHIRSRRELDGLVAGLRDDPGMYTWFVRTPVDIEVDSAGGRAFETGRWVQHTREEGVVRTDSGGRYTAYWRRVAGRWLIHAEVFVTLSGGAAGR